NCGRRGGEMAAAQADLPRIVTVFGSSQPREGDADYTQAYELGRRLALAGYTLCNGGTGGTMRAAAQGAREAGGRTIGVTMDIYIPDPPNSWLDEEIRVADLFTRLQRLILPASGYVCLRGGCGTLAEWALVWTLLASGLVPPAPLILFGEEWRPLVASIKAGMLPRERDWSFLQLAATVEEVLTILCMGPPAVPAPGSAGFLRG
ncbi:MAG TPA: LOG family protein, partial [Ktedonobacterales bacterium]|nr:LOG family protein [Ktedonobacterales bacterium]